MKSRKTGMGGGDVPICPVQMTERSIRVWESHRSSVCFASVCVCVFMTHAGAQAAWQARPPFGWLASRREHGRGRKWSLAAGSRKD